MSDPTLFHGIAVLIDDDIADPTAGIRHMQTQIEAAGCHVVQMSKLPTADGIFNLRAVSFCILDWNLYGREMREAAGGVDVPVPEGVKRENAAQAVEFLKNLKKVCVAPVFIFTNEPIEEVEDILREHPELFDEKDPSHILVRSKGEVTDAGVFNVLSDWVDKAPSVYVLKKWERVYEKAKNELFLDFYARSVHWPLVLWRTYKTDGIDESLELGNLIGRNLHSRMTPFQFDLTAYNEALEAINSDAGKSKDIVLKVLEGERFLPKDRLQPDSIAPGDVFKKGSDYFVNIRPDCDCIARGGASQDDVKLYLLKGCKLKDKHVAEKANIEYGTILERDTENIVFAMAGGESYSFQFKNLTIETWGVWKTRRMGRLLPPFLTRLQQRYSAYLQRPGLTRIPESLLPFVAKDLTEACTISEEPAAVATKEPSEGF